MLRRGQVPGGAWQCLPVPGGACLRGRPGQAVKVTNLPITSNTRCTDARVHRGGQVAAGPGGSGNKGSWTPRLRLLPIDNCIDRRAQGGTLEAFTFVWCLARRPSPGGSAAQRSVHNANPTVSAALPSLLPAGGQPQARASSLRVSSSRFSAACSHLHR